ncbi:hypothetical protein [Neptuniibacter sp. QD34_54]|uniref:hypothetical protein n=1 Tax=Neptuniibacter sp. QD34_54 TaxID=3398208 RepID=UPI0039F4E370
MSADYNWKCAVCDTVNIGEYNFCSKCSSSAELNSIEIAERKRAVREGVAFDDQSDEVLAPRTKQGKALALATDISMGENPEARMLGTIFFYVVIHVAIVAIAIRTYQLGSLDGNSLVSAFIGIFAALEVKRFCLGKTTYLESYIATAVKGNTFIRWIGLALDIVLLYVALAII